ERIARRDARGVATVILHRVASAEVRKARVSDDDTDASEHPAQAERPPARLLRCREVCARTGLSRTTLWRLECRGQFPSRRQLATNTVGWLEAEVEGWIATRVSRRDHHAPNGGMTVRSSAPSQCDPVSSDGGEPASGRRTTGGRL